MQWAPGKKSIFKVEDGEEEYDEADLDAPMLDLEDGQPEGEVSQPSLPLNCFIGYGNNPILAKKTLVDMGYQVMGKGT